MRVHFSFIEGQEQLWKFKGWKCSAERLLVNDCIVINECVPKKSVLCFYRLSNPELSVLPRFYGKAKETHVVGAPFTCNAGHQGIYLWMQPTFSRFDGFLIVYVLVQALDAETTALLYRKMGMGNPEWDRVYPFDPAFRGTVFSNPMFFAYLERDDSVRPLYAEVTFLPQRTEFSEEVHRRLVLEALTKHPDVVCIKAHGSGTRENDEKEAKLYSELNLPVVALKHRFNHTRMATIVEDFYLAVRLAEGVIPGSCTERSILPQLVLTDRETLLPDRFKFLSFATGFLGSYSVVVWEVDKNQLLENVRAGLITIEELLS